MNGVNRQHGNGRNGHHGNGNNGKNPHVRDPRVAQAFAPRALRYAHMIGWGKALPDRIMPNAEFEPLVNTNDEWIYTRTGIRQRRIAAEAKPPRTSPSVPPNTRLTWRAYCPPRSTM